MAEYRFDFNIQNSDGYSALHLCALRGSHIYVETLLQMGADITLKTLEGRTALHIAAARGYHEFVEILLQNGADVNNRDNSEQTPLHCAVQSQNTESVQMLLNWGADVNTERTDSLLTPLGIASKDTAQVLVRHMALMLAQNMEVCESNMKILYGTSNELQLKEYTQSCDAEIIRIKNTMIGNSSMSFFDLIVEEDDVLVKYFKNPDVVKELALEEEYMTRFPIYGEALKKCIQGVRAELVQQASNALLLIFPQCPDNCLTLVVNNLIDEDLCALSDIQIV